MVKTTVWLAILPNRAVSAIHLRFLGLVPENQNPHPSRTEGCLGRS